MIFKDEITYVPSSTGHKLLRAAKQFTRPFTPSLHTKNTQIKRAAVKDPKSCKNQKIKKLIQLKRGCPALDTL